MAEIIDGKKLAGDVLDEVRAGAEALAARGVVPGLAAILVGDDTASESYVRGKRRDAEKCGMTSVLHRMPQRTEADDLAEVIDGLNAANVGLLAGGRPRFVPCTPSGVQQMLVRSGVEVAGAHVVIVGRSQLVGRPLSMLLSQKAPGANATVTLCHTGTRELAGHTRRADILVVAAGAARSIGADHVSKGCVVIDVGINPGPDRTLVGDVDFDAVAPVARAISPVPGGVGPMTRAMLMVNTLRAAQLAAGEQ